MVKNTEEEKMENEGQIEGTNTNNDEFSNEREPNTNNDEFSNEREPNDNSARSNNARPAFRLNLTGLARQTNE